MTTAYACILYALLALAAAGAIAWMFRDRFESLRDDDCHREDS